jgi:hypothetical protein
MRIKGYKVYSNGKLLFNNVDIELPCIEFDISQLTKLIEDITNTKDIWEKMN